MPEIEAERYKPSFNEFGTLYIGGGTPSLPGAGHIKKIISGISGIFSFTHDAEITIEANPDDITKEKIHSYLSSGINRISLGVQSFDDDELIFLGRRHDSNSCEKAIDMIRAGGVSNLGIDLIFGFHAHTIDAWRRTLEKTIEISPEHISCYQMTLAKSTEMGRMLSEGKISEVSEEEQRDLFLLADRILTDNGYLHYEISNYAKGDENISKHNSRYWDRTDYLGLGPSAHSMNSGKRWWNISSVREYCDLLESGGDIVKGREELSKIQIALEDLYLGFRTLRGVPFSVIDKYPYGMKILERLTEEGLVVIKEGFAVPTLSGFLVADKIPLLFYRPE